MKGNELTAFYKYNNIPVNDARRTNNVWKIKEQKVLFLDTRDLTEGLIQFGVSLVPSLGQQEPNKEDHHDGQASVQPVYQLHAAQILEIKILLQHKKCDNIPERQAEPTAQGFGLLWEYFAHQGKGHCTYKQAIDQPENDKDSNRRVVDDWVS